MSPECFLEKLVCFMFLPGKRGGMLMEAFFFFLTLSLMVFRIFVKSLFLELCTRISALILKNTMSCYPHSYLQNQVANVILYFWLLKSYCLEDKMMMLAVTAKVTAYNFEYLEMVVLSLWFQAHREWRTLKNHFRQPGVESSTVSPPVYQLLEQYPPARMCTPEWITYNEPQYFSLQFEQQSECIFCNPFPS